MKLKNAGIKSVDELVKRLISGETIYAATHVKLMYDPINIKLDIGISPFRYVYLNGKTEPMNEVWQDFANLLVEDRWEDNIGEGVACWVSDYQKSPDHTCSMRVIVGYAKNDSHKYIALNSICWLYAKPVGDEIEKYLLKNR